MENTLLNLIPAAYLPEIHLSQYDIGRTLTFTLKDGASDYSVPSGASVKVKATKPSGFGFEVACTFNGGTVTLVTTETMTLENGRFPAELSIVSGNTTIGTSNFIFNIERSPHPEGTTDGDAETIIPELTLLVERIEAAAEDVDEKSELFLNLSAEAETLPAGSPATASYSNGVLTLGIPRGYDGDDTKADAIVKSASGEVASFTDGGNGLLVKSLIANITPKQSGSGDPSPSNVRPISGVDTVAVTRAGKNVGRISQEIINNDRHKDGITFHALSSTKVKITGTSTATVYMTSGYPISSPYLRLLKKGTYTFSNGVKASGINGAYVTGYPVSGGASRNLCNNIHEGQTATFTIAEDFYINIQMLIASGYTANDEVWFQLEEGTSATPYEPYNGTTYTTSLGQTVYGGTLDVVSGKLTINKGYAEFDGSSDENWLWNANNSLAGISINNGITITGDNQRNIYTQNNLFKDASWVSRASADGTVGLYFGRSTLFMKYSQFASVNDVKTFLASNPLQVVYTLETPTEIQLTPTEVTTLLGNNNIWADSGSVEVEYRADTTLAYNELLSLIASLS